MGILLVGGTSIIVHKGVLVKRRNERKEILVNLSKFTDFGLCVKTKLLQIGKDQKWLEDAVNAKTGLFMDGGYMYKILTGQRNAPKVIEAIKEILELEE